MKSLGDELAAPATPLTQPRGKRVSPLGPDADNDLEETAMPRKKKQASTAAPPSDAPKKPRKKWTRRTPAVPANGEARFGVFSDGTVQIDAASCKGNLSPEEALSLIAFLHKLKTTRP